VVARFPTTRWSRVVQAADPADPGARVALGDLCRDYWFPLYAFVRRKGVSPPEAEDLVQGFLADLLERGDLATVDRSRGRFRSFLRASCEHYLSNVRDHERAKKRGRDVAFVSIDRLDAESRYAREPSHSMTAECVFERQWALTLLGRVLERLQAEAGSGDKAALFACLRPALQGEDPGGSYAAIGAEMGMSEGAVRVAAHRLRVRYRELLRDEVSRTTNDPTTVNQEIVELMAALAGHN
jgi:DNA-directed RNA polymerase specialized sigma24 family protein